MKKIYLIVTLGLYFVLSASAQEENTRIGENGFSLTAPSFTRLFSLNYERVISQKNWISIAHVGVYHLPLGQTTAKLKAAFIGVDFLRGKKKHYLDLGMSLMFDSAVNFEGSPEHPRTLGLDFIPKIGYRFQKKPKGLFLRAMLMPFLIEIMPREPIDQYEKNHFIFTSPSVDLVACSIGFTF